jgi:aspartate aminotransferase-like enzyme
LSEQTIGSETGDYEWVLLHGRGAFDIESVISSAIPLEGRLLVLVNGAFGISSFGQRILFSSF